MLVKILGVIDLILGLILIFGRGNSLSPSLLLICGIILLAKASLGLLKNFASWIDFVCGIIFLLLTIISFHSLLLIIVGILVLQKGVFSLIEV